MSFTFVPIFLLIVGLLLWALATNGTLKTAGMCATFFAGGMLLITATGGRAVKIGQLDPATAAHSVTT